VISSSFFVQSPFIKTIPFFWAKSEKRVVLRRRFSFTEVLPNSKLLENKSVNGINLKKLLDTINNRIEILLNRDHTIGHSYFIKLDNDDVKGLKSTFKNNIIPLLQEYFYGDYAKMEMVIGPDFFNSEKRKKKVTFAIQNEDIEIPTGNYELMNILDPNFNFVSAINRLLNRKIREIEVN
jgi:5-methylcytosine-specific restriction protein B